MRLIRTLLALVLLVALTDGARLWDCGHGVFSRAEAAQAAIPPCHQEAAPAPSDKQDCCQGFHCVKCSAAMAVLPPAPGGTAVCAAVPVTMVTARFSDYIVPLPLPPPRA